MAGNSLRFDIAQLPPEDHDSKTDPGPGYLWRKPTILGNEYINMTLLKLPLQNTFGYEVCVKGSGTIDLTGVAIATKNYTNTNNETNNYQDPKQENFDDFEIFNSFNLLDNTQTKWNNYPGSKKENEVFQSGENIASMVSIGLNAISYKYYFVTDATHVNQAYNYYALFEITYESTNNTSRTIYVLDGEKFSIGKPLKTGYTFSGWNGDTNKVWENWENNAIEWRNKHSTSPDKWKNKNFSNIEIKENNSGKTIPLLSLQTGTINLKAKWVPNKYTINFDSYYGTKINSMLVEFDNYYTYNAETGENLDALPVPTRRDCEFCGWYHGDKQITDGNGVLLKNETGDFFRVTTPKDHTLTARWKGQGTVTLYYDNEWRTALVYVYNEGEWKTSVSYIYDGSNWQLNS